MTPGSAISAHLVDPELGATLEALPTFALSDETLKAARNGAGEFPRVPADESLPVDVVEVQVPASDWGPKTRALVYRPRGVTAPLPAIFHIHGGGYVLGDPEISDASNRLHAARLQCLVFSVAYRLAPENGHPDMLYDCYGALLWLYANAQRRGVDSQRIGIKGESAGGGLAAALALLARDRGEVRLAFQQLLSPMLDDRTAVRTDLSPFLGEFVWTRANNAFGWRALLGQHLGGGNVSAYASPARAVDLAGLPPTFIDVGALDLFLAEDIDYARRLAEAGVPIELHVYPGAFHGFEMAANSRVAIAAERDRLEALRRWMYG